MIPGLAKKIVPIRTPQAIVDAGSWTTTAIDTKGWDYMSVFVMFGATDIDMVALKLQTSDEDGSYADLTGADFTVAPATIPQDDDDNTVWAIHVDLRDKKRFFDLVATAGDGTAGTYLVAWAELSRGENVPSSATERGLAQELIV